MFRDREKELRRLQQQLLQEDMSAQEEEEVVQVSSQEVYDGQAKKVRAYNADRADTPLDTYSDAVYDGPRRTLGCVPWLLLLMAAGLLAAAWFLAKRGGLL